MTEDKPGLRSSKATFGDGRIITVYGPPETGKTRLAASASKHWPRDVSWKDIQGTALTDMLFLCFDSCALDGLTAKGFEVPCLLFDEFLAHYESPVKASQAMVQEARRLYAQPDSTIRYIVQDTISTLDRAVVAHYESLFGEASLAQSKDRDYTARKYGKVQQFHNDHHVSSKQTMAKLIYCCHSTAKIPLEKDDAKHKTKQKAWRADATTEIGPDVTGQGARLYVTEPSLVIVTRRKQTSDGYKYEAQMRSKDNFEAKCRFDTILDIEEPDLGKILDKIPQKAVTA